MKRWKYSVPYDLIGEKVDVKLTKHVVEVFCKQTRVAAHVRLDKEQRDPVVKPEHTPEWIYWNYKRVQKKPCQGFCQDTDERRALSLIGQKEKRLKSLNFKRFSWSEC